MHKKPIFILIIIAIFFAIVISLLSYLVFTKINKKSDTTVILNSQSENNSKEKDKQESLETTDTPTITSTESTISGSLTYPSEEIPSMKVCAVSTTDNKETCIETKKNQLQYSLTVQPGEYLVYSQDNTTNYIFKAYYTKCDTLEDTFVPECNSNAGGGESWNSTGFVCFKDPTCKAAFTPLKIEVESGSSIKLNPILQGWYIPCSYDTTVCNDPKFDVWKDYLK